MPVEHSAQLMARWSACFRIHYQALSLRRRTLDGIAGCVSSNSAKGLSHRGYYALCSGQLMTLFKPARIVIGKPGFARCVLPDEHFQRQINANRLIGLHQRSAAARVAEENDFGWSQRQSRLRRQRG